MNKVIILAILLLSLFAVSCTQKEETPPKPEPVKENTTDPAPGGT